MIKWVFFLSNIFASKKIFCNGRIDILLEHTTQFALYNLRQWWRNHYATIVMAFNILIFWTYFTAYSYNT